MIRLSHVVCVTEIREAIKSAYLHIAQPVTLHSMLEAKRCAETVGIHVDLRATRHHEEKYMIPDGINWTEPLLSRYCHDVLTKLPGTKKLPFLKDIIEAHYASSDAEYFIYTNVDIGLFPAFYVVVAEIIKHGYDAFCINRRTMPKEINTFLIDESNYPLIFHLDGQMHPGIDCFVFKREIVPMLQLGNTFIGAPPIGQVLKTQIENHSHNFRWFNDLRLTFHLGNDSSWSDKSCPYLHTNYQEARGLYKAAFPWEK